MSTGKVLRSLRPEVVWKTSRYFLTRPAGMLAAFLATRSCLKLSGELFGKAHHRNGKANAFRQALWNMLIIKYSMKMGYSTERALKWADEITLHHEDLSPNPPLARIMDLHNNRIGRDLWTGINCTASDPDGLLAENVMNLLKSAVRVSSLEDTGKHPEKLIYIED
ncbi:DUF6973 domain-containing protein [Robertkochia aurantiaca]|uniref:DUF6973 domain-containing protein n=1 Tax=Robertkochia aurantiaca TaxID=2873700 RepID=UPI001CCAF790|nr:hypothetical protein [Robertkochia sp. 3YJGBD-33]